MSLGRTSLERDKTKTCELSYRPHLYAYSKSVVVSFPNYLLCWMEKTLKSKRCLRTHWRTIWSSPPRQTYAIQNEFRAHILREVCCGLIPKLFSLFGGEVRKCCLRTHSSPAESRIRYSGFEPTTTLCSLSKHSTNWAIYKTTQLVRGQIYNTIQSSSILLIKLPSTTAHSQLSHSSITKLQHISFAALQPLC